MTTDLLPCPFCGASAELRHNKTWDYEVRCTKCRVKTRQHHENSVGAVMDWNKRAMLANGATVEAIRDAQFARAIQHIVDSCTDYGIVDIEESHIEADDLLCDLLCAHGYVETVDAFKSMRKWYG